MKKPNIDKHRNGWALHIPIARKYWLFPTWRDAVDVVHSAKLCQEMLDYSGWMQSRGIARKDGIHEGPANLPKHLRRKG